MVESAETDKNIVPSYPNRAKDRGHKILPTADLGAKAIQPATQLKE